MGGLVSEWFSVQAASVLFNTPFHILMACLLLYSPDKLWALEKRVLINSSLILAEF